MTDPADPADILTPMAHLVTGQTLGYYRITNRYPDPAPGAWVLNLTDNDPTPGGPVRPRIVLGSEIGPYATGFAAARGHLTDLHAALPHRFPELWDLDTAARRFFRSPTPWSIVKAHPDLRDVLFETTPDPGTGKSVRRTRKLTAADEVMIAERLAERWPHLGKEGIVSRIQRGTLQVVHAPRQRFRRVFADEIRAKRHGNSHDDHTAWDDVARRYGIRAPLGPEPGTEWVETWTPGQPVLNGPYEPFRPDLPETHRRITALVHAQDEGWLDYQRPFPTPSGGLTFHIAEIGPHRDSLDVADVDVFPFLLGVADGYGHPPIAYRPGLHTPTIDTWSTP